MSDLLTFVEKLPKLFEISKNFSFEIPSVRIFKLAPNALAPFVEVPTPRCNCIFSTEELKSGKLTQKVP